MRCQIAKLNANRTADREEIKPPSGFFRVQTSLAIVGLAMMASLCLASPAARIEELGNCLTDMQVRYRSAPLIERMAMKPALDKAYAEYQDFQLKIIKGEVK